MANEEAAIAASGQLSRRGLVVGASTVATLAALGGLGVFGAEAAYAAPLWRHPFAFPAGMGDGYRPPHRPNHNAVDYGYGGVTYNTPIYAVAAGTVIGKRFTPGGIGSGSHGHDITIQHADGWTSHYAHMNTASPLSVGDSVPSSGYVGPVGSTGDSTGAHLHIELKNGGVYQDPTYLIHHTVAPLAQPGDDMPHYAHKQSTASLSLTSGVNNRLTFNGLSDYDLAGAPAGGAGIYDITCHLYLQGLVAPATISFQFVLEKIADGSTEGWYSQTVEGNATGEVKAQITTKLDVPTGRRLMLYANPSVGGVTIPVWGRAVCNWQH